MKPELSRHAERRAQQRGYRRFELDLIRHFGTPVGDGFVLLEKDVAPIESALKRLITSLRRLQGSALIEQAGTVVTVYRPDKKRRRRIARSR